MNCIKREITKEEYDKLKKLPYSKQEKELFPNGIPVDWACGYGYYGHGLIERDGKFYACFTIGSSCD